MRTMRISLAIPLAVILTLGTTACAGTEISGSPTTGSVAATAGSSAPARSAATRPSTPPPSTTRLPSQPTSQPSRTQAPATEPPTAPDSTTENPATTRTSPPDVTFVPDPGTTLPPADSSASDALEPFFAAADTADAALTAAAAAVNDSYAGDTVTFTRATVDLVDQARPSAVAAAIPAGLDRDVQRAVLLVYSDLESRFAALHGESCVQVGTFTRADLDPHCFAEGHAAAVAMPADVAAAHAAASSAAPFTDAGAHSREAAEVALSVGYVDGNNEGCGSHGGFRATDPIDIAWNGDPSAVNGADSGDGVTNGVQFTASWTGEAWSVRYLAC
ncbi:hypothetical protein ACVBEQ_14955 [Nakamurella sp. GG22]